MAEFLRSLREALKPLPAIFGSTKPPSTLPAEARRILQSFIEEHADSIGPESAARANHELRGFWDKYIRESPQKLGAFVGVLRELRPALVDDEAVLEWYTLAAKPVISSTGYKKAAVEDAQDCLTGVMVHEGGEEGSETRVHISRRLCRDLIGLYLSRTRPLTDEDHFVAPENAQIAHQVETVLLGFGRKMPVEFFRAVDHLVLSPDSRLQALLLLSSFLRQQAPHMYQVLQTPLIDHLLQCLMNDVATTVLSIAMTCLIMLLPHIPGSLEPRLPKLFLIYSRMLCWEKFSPLSSAEQRNAVTDDRVSSDPDRQHDHGDVGVDPHWQKARPRDGEMDDVAPELMTYFTYLYGLYPLNLMSYIRKPRKYLKGVNFHGADDFDLDQAVIRSRSDQFREVHLMHPNFYLSTIDEELTDPKWPKMDPADVAAECLALYANPHQPSPASPGPPPSGKLPGLPPPAPGDHGAVSPTMSHMSLRSGISWRDTGHALAPTAASGVESPVLGPSNRPEEEELHESLRPRSKGSTRVSRASPLLGDSPLPSRAISTRSAKVDPPQTNLEYLQREIALLRTDLNYERWRLIQYSQHIRQLTQRNVKDATVEAETFNLINANRALKQQMEQIRSAREATMRDSALTRKQANNMESNMTERMNKMKKEQEAWAADAEDLRRLRAETGKHRDLLADAEARQAETARQLEIAKREVEDREALEAQLQDARRQLQAYDQSKFDFDRANRERDILESQKQTLEMKIRRVEQDCERMNKVYTEKVTELEIQIQNAIDTDPPDGGGPPTPAPSSVGMDASAKLIQLRKAHALLLEKYTDLEMEYHSVKSQLETLQKLTGYVIDPSAPDAGGGGGDDSSLFDADTMMFSGSRAGSLGHVGVLESMYGDEPASPGGPRFGPPRSSTSAPASHQYRSMSMATPPSPPHSDARVPHGSSAAATADPRRSRDSHIPGAAFNVTRPLGADECSVYSADLLPGQPRSGKKIQPDSVVRVYGRGGAQNIKMKAKTPKSEKADKPDKSSKSGLRGLRLM